MPVPLHSLQWLLRFVQKLLGISSLKRWNWIPLLLCAGKTLGIHRFTEAMHGALYPGLASVKVGSASMKYMVPPIPPSLLHSFKKASCHLLNTGKTMNVRVDPPIDSLMNPYESQNHASKVSWIPDPQKLFETMNVLCFKLQSLG